MTRSGVRSSLAPPLFKKPTTLGWFFFAQIPQCWRGFGLHCDGRSYHGHPRFRLFGALCSRPFSVSATDAAALALALARVSGGLFVSKTAFTQATRLRTGLLVDDGADIPSDRHSGPIDDLVAVLDAGLQVLGNRLVPLLDLLDRPVDGVAESVTDVFALVACLAELSAFADTCCESL